VHQLCELQEAIEKTRTV